MSVRRAVVLGRFVCPTVAIATWLGLTLAATWNESPSVRMTAVKTRVLIDEPVIVTVAFSGFRDIYLGGSLARDNPYFAVLIDRGAGYSPFGYKAIVAEDYQPVGRQSLKGRPLVWDIPAFL
jgi:hypothetical protein